MGIGKAHGACTSGPGNDPATAFREGTKIWEGVCGGDGKGANTVTSGFEGYWTSNPTTWDNEYFVNLVTKNWTVHEGPGGKKQWQTEGSNLMMLTADLALMEDEDYRAIVEEFAGSQAALDAAFDLAWFDLTTTNIGSGLWSSAAFCTDGSAVPAKHLRQAISSEGVVACPLAPQLFAYWPLTEQVDVRVAPQPVSFWSCPVEAGEFHQPFCDLAESSVRLPVA